MQTLQNQILQLENYISDFERTNAMVSISTIGWQIDHCLIIINSVMEQLEISNPEEFKPEFNFKKIIVFTTGKIPRGKVRAPKSVTPIDVATADELKIKVELAKKNSLKLEILPKKSHFKHPFFKDLNVKQTEKFLRIHNHHHLKIIEDILK